MSHSYIRHLFSERIGGNQFGLGNTVYKFEKIKCAKREAISKNPNVPLLDFGVGEPDEMTFEPVRQKIKNEIDDPDNRSYADNGIIEFKQAAALYMKNRFDVDLDYHLQVNHSVGMKCALAMFPAIFINPGDLVLMTNPGYPVLGIHTKWYGGDFVSLPLTKENYFFPRLDEIPKEMSQRAKILVLNYPNNPTGKCATKEFYSEVVRFAKQNEIVVVQDAAYAELVYSPHEFISFLSVDGAMDVGVEFHSLSKGFNMTGWRIAFVCGNPLIVTAFASVKNNIDSGQFIPIQKAAIVALSNPSMNSNLIAKYSRRLDSLVSILRAKGFTATKPEGTFFLYVPAPKATRDGLRFDSAEDFSQFLIKKKLISTVPWDEVGAYIRFSVTFPTSDQMNEQCIFNELKSRLSDLDLVF